MMESWHLAQRPDRKSELIFSEVTDDLEELIESTVDPESVEQLKNIETTMVELYSTALVDFSVVYYQRVMNMYPNLNLPAPRWEEVDES